MVKQLIVIDDEPRWPDEVKGLLRRWGLEYRVVSNDDILKPVGETEEEREHFCQRIVKFVGEVVTDGTEAILLDVLFEQASGKDEPLGYTLGKKLRRHFPKVPIILFTIRGEPEEFKQSTEVFNFDGYIPKSSFSTWRTSTHFVAELYKAKSKREETLEEFEELMRHRGASHLVSPLPTTPINPVIIHISDIHYGIDLGTSDSRLAYGSTLDALARDVNENYEEQGIPKPNLIVVSGDITNKSSLEGYPLAKRFLLDLGESMTENIPPERIVLAPGNHDVNRPMSRFACGLNPFDESVTEEGVRSGYYPYRFAPFKSFFDDFYGGAKVYSLEKNRMFTIFDYSVPYRIVIVSFNSCEQIDHSKVRMEHAYISLDTVVEAKHELRSLGLAGPGIIKMAVWHHPLLFETPGDPSYHSEVLDELSKEGFVMYLHGHIHKPFNNFQPEKGQGMYEFGAGTIGAGGSDRPADWPRHYEI